MIKNNNLFSERVRLLTGTEIGLNDSMSVHVHPKYRQIFDVEIGDQKVSVKDVAVAVNNVLLRKEEHGSASLDKWGRFDHDRSNLVGAGFDQVPIIDQLMLDVLKQLHVQVKNIWPGRKKVAVCLTHDVDSIDGLSNLWLRKLGWHVNSTRAKLTGNRQAADAWASTLKQWNGYKALKYDPIDSFDQIQELEASYGFRSTFFFMSLKHALSREGRRYSVTNPRVAEVSKNLLNGGWEIGLHASYHEHLSASSIKDQKHRLEDVIQNKVSGCRHHFLRVRFPESWGIYAQTGFKYSSNMGWGAGFQGFRAGTCLPYQPLTNYSFLEIPFQLMDVNPTKDVESYMDMFTRYLNLAKSVGGCLAIDFHQEYFREEVATGVGKVYRRILDCIAKESDVAVLTMGEVYDFVSRDKAS